MKKYAIWDKVSPIITPIGEVLSPEQWIQRYPVAGIDNITIICAAGEINGGIFATLGQMVQNAEAAGCDFSDCTTDLEKLQRIEDFEDEMNAPAENLGPTPEERTAYLICRDPNYYRNISVQSKVNTMKWLCVLSLSGFVISVIVGIRLFILINGSGV